MIRNKKEIGIRIREIRKENNLTYKKFGALISNAASGTVSNWESGIYVPNRKRLEQIANLGNTTIDYLIWGDVNIHIENILLDLSKKCEINLIRFKDELISIVKLSNVPYGDISKLIQILLEIDPLLFNVFKEHNIFTELNINEKDFINRNLNTEYMYEKYYKQMLVKIFKDEITFENILESEKHKLISETLDMLVKTSLNDITVLNNIIKSISWVSSGNIVSNSFNEDIRFHNYCKRTRTDMKTDFKKLELLLKLDLKTLK